jgi:murein DD-endopeptidase MepM/ murein hydrolase activator NlpD
MCADRGLRRPLSTAKKGAVMLKTLLVPAAMLFLVSIAHAQSVTLTERSDVAYAKLADGFDFPVGKPDAEGYYKARGYRPDGHLGEDWDGIRGGDSDLGDAIYSIGEGVVVFARDVHLGWGNVVIARYMYREDGQIKTIDALYGHLDSMLVRSGQRVARGQQIGTMGTAHGIYDAHLHFEIRKNLEIGMSRAAFRGDLSNYHDPTQFIAAHRRLETSSANYPVALNTFTHDRSIDFAMARNYSAPRTVSSHSAAESSHTATDSKKTISFEPVTPLDD